MTGGVALDPGFAQNLVATKECFNRFATTGVDEDFARGAESSELDCTGFVRPGNHPNKTMYPLADVGPYCAIIVAAGTLDIKGGPRTDTVGRVLRSGGTPVARLYGVGNCVASPAGSGYWSGGNTLGIAITFGYLAGRAISGERPRAERTAVCGLRRRSGAAVDRTLGRIDLPSTARLGVPRDHDREAGCRDGAIRAHDVIGDGDALRSHPLEPRACDDPTVLHDDLAVIVEFDAREDEVPVRRGVVERHRVRDEGAEEEPAPGTPDDVVVPRLVEVPEVVHVLGGEFVPVGYLVARHAAADDTHPTGPSACGSVALKPADHEWRRGPWLRRR